MAIPSQVALKNVDQNDPNQTQAYIVPITDFKFPLDIDSGIGIDSGPFMLMTFFEYERKINDPTKAKKKFSVCLPLPANLAQNHGANYSAFKADFLMDAALEGFKPETTGGDIGVAIGAALAKMSLRTGEMSAGNKFPAYYRVKDELNGNLGDTISNVFGIIVNPRQELKYVGPELRRHSFDYLILPKNSMESVMVRQMIESIEDAMYPSFQDKFNIFLNYPLEVAVDFYTAEGKKILGVLPIPDSFIESFNVTVNPQGASARLFDDGAPTGYRISMSLVESNQLTRESLQALRTK